MSIKTVADYRPTGAILAAIYYVWYDLLQVSKRPLVRPASDMCLTVYLLHVTVNGPLSIVLAVFPSALECSVSRSALQCDLITVHRPLLGMGNDALNFCCHQNLDC